jgi:hypothetical protein
LERVRASEAGNADVERALLELVASFWDEAGQPERAAAYRAQLASGSRTEGQ